MKTFAVTAAVALASGIACGSALAQQRTVQGPTITIGSTEPSPESPSAARAEAAAVWAEAQQSCRQERDHQARHDCLEAAREDRRQLLHEAEHRQARS
jgi:hypothetical protein